LEEMSMQQFYPLYQQQLDPTKFGHDCSSDKNHASGEILELYYTPGPELWLVGKQ
jgi:hypothetical protein